jgi:hypothetical protein
VPLALPISQPMSVATGTTLANQSLAFSGPVRLVVNSASGSFSYVGANGAPLPHGLSTGATLYYQSSDANLVAGRAGLITTNTTDPAAATAYTVKVLSSSSFQLLLNGNLVNLSDAAGPAGDALVGLQATTVTTPTSTTTINLVGSSVTTVGQEWLTYDLALLQDGFYNPAQGLIREYLIPGIDFQLGAINWSGTSQPNSSQAWEDYSDAQVNAVLASTGYLPLYATNISNVQRHQLVNGQSSVQAIANPWALTANQIWVPSSGPLQGLAIEGQTEALAQLYSATSAAVGPTGALGLAGGPSDITVPGSGQKVSAFADLPDLQVGGAFTVEAWVLPSQLGGSTSVLALAAGNDSLSLQIDSSGYAVLNGVEGSRSTSVISINPLPLNTWTHLAAVVQATGSVVLYGNGVAIGSGSLDAPVSDQRWLSSVSMAPATGSSGLVSAIHDLKLWNGARSVAEVVRESILSK